MREERNGSQIGRGLCDQIDEPGKVVGLESQPVHSGIEFDVYGIIAEFSHPYRCQKGEQRAKTEYLRFKFVLQKLFERSAFGIHYHNGYPDSLIAKLFAFVGKGHRQIINPVILQYVGNLKAPAAIREGLDHGRYLCLGTEQRPEMVKIVNHCIEVNLQNGFMHLLFEGGHNLFEPEYARPFNQNGLIGEVGWLQLLQKLACGFEKTGILSKKRGLCRDIGADSNESGNVFGFHQTGHLRIEPVGVTAALENIRKDERFCEVLVLQIQEIERDGQRAQIGVITVVYQCRSENTLFLLQPHLYRMECCHPFGNGSRRIT